MTSPIRFGIVGSGWRSEFFLRIARARPDLFEVTGLCGRDHSKAQRVAAVGKTQAYASWRELVDKTGPDFVVSSVSWAAAPEIMRDLVAAGMPVLSETPPAPDVKGLSALWRKLGASAPVQVAEQYAFQPHHSARLSFVYGGKLGDISQVQMSVAHGYHGLNLMRRFLGIGFETATITAKRFRSPVIAGADRSGPPRAETRKQADQDLAWFDFGGKLGVFDFTAEQYFSYIRDQRLLVRGERGELFNDSAVYLADAATPIRVYFTRHEGGSGGNLEGKYLKGIQAGEHWLYRNVFAPAALPDDELAIATCLTLMHSFVKTGQGFYGLAEACQDTYLSFALNDALATGKARTKKQAWAG
jgi:predicted dehydrogenase